MVHFINVKTEQVWSFKDWEEVISLGGVKTIFKEYDYNDIYNLNACKETYNQIAADIRTSELNDTIRICAKNTSVSLKEAIKYVEPFEKAIMVYEKQKKSRMQAYDSPC